MESTPCLKNRQPATLRCIGCGTSARLASLDGRTTVQVCPPCAGEAQNPRIRKLMMMAAARGLTLREAAMRAGFRGVA